jgi:hypothetical protein
VIWYAEKKELQNESQAPNGKIDPETPWDRMLECSLVRSSSNAHHLQLSVEVKTPPRRGPTTVATMKTPIQMPISRGRLFGVTVKLMIKTEPLSVPEQPHPWIARPMIKVIEFGAAAATTLPTRYKIRALM